MTHVDAVDMGTGLLAQQIGILVDGGGNNALFLHHAGSTGTLLNTLLGFGVSVHNHYETK
jgi:hypothetical protein